MSFSFTDVQSQTKFSSHLDKSEFAEAGAALGVPDGDLAVVLDPPPSAEDVVHTRSDLVPLVVIAKSESTWRRLDVYLLPTWRPSGPQSGP